MSVIIMEESFDKRFKVFIHNILYGQKPVRQQRERRQYVVFGLGIKKFHRNQSQLQHQTFVGIL